MLEVPRAQQRIQLPQGPPEYVFDTHGLPLAEGETHVSKVWYMAGGEEVSAELEVCT